MKPIRLGQRIPSLYIEHAKVSVSKGTVVTASEKEAVLPVSSVATLLLGPGTSISHDVVKTCSRAGCVVQWVGEEGIYAYGAAEPLVGHPERLERQVLCAVRKEWRDRVARTLFERRFRQKLASHLDVETVRGMEGNQVKALYNALAAEHAVPWPGRDPRGTDALNQAISRANGHLLQAATVAVLGAGFSPAIGFLHRGFRRAFACDIADLHKFETTVPLAFRLAASGTSGRTEIRHAVRDLVAQKHLIDRMLRDSMEVINAGAGAEKGA